jgi:DNA-binding NtrC family response regulator
VTYAQFQRLQIRERNEFLQDAIQAHHGNLARAATALKMPPFVLKRYVKRYQLVPGYGSRRPIRGDARMCRVVAPGA